MKECVASILRDMKAAGASSNADVTQTNTFFLDLLLRLSVFLFL